MAAAELTAAHTGTPAHDPTDDSFSTTVRCHDANGELYNVTFSRDRVTVQSYSELEARWLLVSRVPDPQKLEA